MSESAVQKARVKQHKRLGNSIRSQKRSQQIADTLSFIAVVVIAALVMLPIWWMIRSSLMKSLEIFKWPPQFFPKEWLFSNYNIKPTTFDFWLYLGNTLTIVVPCVVFGTLTAILCGYAFARLRFRGKAFLFSLCVGSMLLPTMVTLIPLYIAWASLGLTDTYWPLILPYLCGGGAFNIFLVRQFIKTLPRELDESASIDGAGYLRTLFSIIMPSIKPAIIVVALLIFITTWNDLLQQTIYISSREKYTMAVGLTTFMGSFKNDYAGMFAATCLSFLPGVVVYLFGQRHFVEGIVMTGMKN
ncbi:MAG TPA: carbohydrate ABC transporter permease [Clostridia bacterium]|jgi:multiple sugar transport system permease protein|nr:carbohydrate ABC transporter permease [Clostridia bacterium]